MEEKINKVNEVIRPDNPKKEELAAEKKKKAEMLDGLKIGAAHKAALVLVLLGLKPAAEIDLKITNEDAESVKAKLKQAGLLFASKEPVRYVKNFYQRLAVARDPETLEKLMAANAGIDHKAYGELMGYPPTAIDAVTKENGGELLPSENYPDMTGIPFAMRLSKEHWHEEAEFLKKWAEELKRYAPKTYKELMPKEERAD